MKQLHADCNGDIFITSRKLVNEAGSQPDHGCWKLVWIHSDGLSLLDGPSLLDGSSGAHRPYFCAHASSMSDSLTCTTNSG